MSPVLCNYLLRKYFAITEFFPQENECSKQLFQNSMQNIHSDEFSYANILVRSVTFYVSRFMIFPNFRFRLSIVKSSLFASDLVGKSWMPCSVFLNYLMGPFWKVTQGIRKK
jgi:hypothetical protein